MVIALISSNFFPQGSIPELPPGLYYPADVSNYREIGVAAQNIVNRCVKEALGPPRQLVIFSELHISPLKLAS